MPENRLWCSFHPWQQPRRFLPLPLWGMILYTLCLSLSLSSFPFGDLCTFESCFWSSFQVDCNVSKWNKLWWGFAQAFVVDRFLAVEWNGMQCGHVSLPVLCRRFMRRWGFMCLFVSVGNCCNCQYWYTLLACVGGIVEIDLQTLGVWEKMLFKGRRRKP